MSWFSRFSLRNSRKYPPPSEEVLVLLSSFICTAMWGWWDFRMPHIFLYNVLVTRQLCVKCSSCCIMCGSQHLSVYLPFWTGKCLIAKGLQGEAVYKKLCLECAILSLMSLKSLTSSVWCFLSSFSVSDEVIYNWINGNRRDSPIWQRGFLTDRNSEVFWGAADGGIFGCSAKAGGGQKLIEFWHEEGADQDEEHQPQSFTGQSPGDIQNTLEPVADFQANHSLNFRGVEQQSWRFHWKQGKLKPEGARRWVLCPILGLTLGSETILRWLSREMQLNLKILYSNMNSVI